MCVPGVVMRARRVSVTSRSLGSQKTARSIPTEANICARDDMTSADCVPLAPTEAAGRRLAFAMLTHRRVGSGLDLAQDLVEMVALNVFGFDHYAERYKQVMHGSHAAAARAQFRPPPAVQLPPVAILLGGHPCPDCNGVYRKVLERQGWPVLRNSAHMYLFGQDGNEWPMGTGGLAEECDDSVMTAWPTDEWRLSDDIHVDRFCSSIATADGRLPVGPRLWQRGATGAQCTCRAELLIGEAAVVAAERRVELEAQLVGTTGRQRLPGRAGPLGYTQMVDAATKTACIQES